MEKPQLIVFDLGGVLVDWNPRYLYRQLFNDEAAMERFLAEICSPEWNAQQDGVRTFAAGTAELVARHPEQRELIEAYFQRWPEMVSDAVGGTVDILRELLATGQRVCALSNWSAETYPHAYARFDFLQQFEFAVISGQIGLMKPQREIFDYVLAKAGVRAEQCLFIDDAPGNVQAARSFGWQAIQFTTPEALRAELTRRGLLVG